MKWRESNKVICLQFREYSCGKFVSNVLSYNDNFMPQYDLDEITLLSQYLDLNYKHQTIMNTIPTVDNLKDWRKFELGNEKFYGINLTDPSIYKKIFHAGSNTRITKNFDDLILNKVKERTKQILEDTDYYVFIISHRITFTKIIKEIFPNVILIELINDQLVNNLSRKIKTKTLNSETLGEINFNNALHKFDIGKLFSKTEFFNEITNLMNKLNCKNTFLDPKVNEYYDKYIEIYKPYI